jgi:hypothetical protein
MLSLLDMGRIAITEGIGKLLLFSSKLPPPPGCNIQFPGGGAWIDPSRSVRPPIVPCAICGALLFIVAVAECGC